MLDNVMRGLGAIRSLKSGQKLLKPKKQALRRIKKSRWRNSIQERNKQTTELKPKPVHWDRDFKQNVSEGKNRRPRPEIPDN